MESRKEEKPAPAQGGLTQRQSISFNQPLMIDREAARKFMIEWIANRTVEIYRIKIHAK